MRLGGLELSVAMEISMAERLKGRAPLSWFRNGHAPTGFRGGEPALNGKKREDIDWYHTIDLGGGVVTPGFVDHRDQLDLYGLPKSLAGKRCLDVATFDGFWAFEMEKRGAAEVVGIDIFSLADADHPTNWHGDYYRYRAGEIKGYGFAYAKRALGSRVQRKVLSVYELAPDRVGMFDFVFMSDLLLHLRDPLKALEAVYTVTRGQAIIADAIDRDLEQSGIENSMRLLLGLDDYSGCFWWNFTSSALEVLLQVARFQDVQNVSEFVLTTKDGKDVPKVVFKARGGD
jgi:tRNA (mo5U34)-methyltransferase